MCGGKSLSLACRAGLAGAIAHDLEIIPLSVEFLHRELTISGKAVSPRARLPFWGPGPGERPSRFLARPVSSGGLGLGVDKPPFCAPVSFGGEIRGG